ncbi:MAG: hypothetical protein JWP74_2754 [Marmoricola sp.]|nr:hypothetical protein [Marmoricola sp.]
MNSWYATNVDGGAVRLGDAGRKAALRHLRRQHARGRIDLAELEERSDAVRSARTHGDLGPVFADLRPVRGGRRSRLYRRGPVPFPLFPLLVIAGIVLATPGHVPWIALGVAAVVLLVLAPRRRRHRGRWAC